MEESHTSNKTRIYGPRGKRNVGRPVKQELMKGVLTWKESAIKYVT